MEHKIQIAATFAEHAPATAYLAEAKQQSGEVGAHALYFDHESAAKFCEAAVKDGGYQQVTVTPLDRRSVVQAAAGEAEITDAQAEHAYWQFDARRKGYAEWRGAPQDEREAFKAEYRAALAMCASAASPAAPVAGSQQGVVELLSKALEDIAQPANAGCGCDFPCRCDTPEAEAINAGAMRDIAHEALKAAAALAAAAPAVPVPADTQGDTK